MTRVAVQAGVRVVGYCRSLRVLPPLLVSVALVLMLYGGGGSALPGEAYGLSALLLFPVMAWHARLALDTEPDVQRLLGVVAVGGPGREAASGLLAAGAAAGSALALGVAAPLGLGALTLQPGPGGLLRAAALGLGLHAVAAAPALAVGAWSSRAVTRSAGGGALLLAGATLAVLLLGLRPDWPTRWLVPQLLDAARAAGEGGPAPGAPGVVVVLHALLWSTAALAGYVVVRRTRT